MADRILAKELVDYAKSDKLLAWQRLVPWINNLAQKKAKGVLDSKRAAKALGDYVARDALDRYAGKSTGIRLDAATKLLFGQMLLRYLMPRINTTAARMKKVGLMKGRTNMKHPSAGVMLY